MEENKTGKTPKWLTAILILMLVPLYPVIDKMYQALHAAGDTGQMALLAKYLPGFAILAALCVYFAYPRNRTVAWVIMAVWALTYIASYSWGCVVIGR